jgi:hypothetical protein
MNANHTFLHRLGTEPSEEQNVMAIAAIRNAAQHLEQPAAGSVDRCPYCGRESLAMAASAWGGGRLSHGICDACGTEIVQFTAAEEPLALPWLVPAMMSSVA